VTTDSEDDDNHGQERRVIETLSAHRHAPALTDAAEPIHHQKKKQQRKSMNRDEGRSYQLLRQIVRGGGVLAANGDRCEKRSSGCRNVNEL